VSTEIFVLAVYGLYYLNVLLLSNEPTKINFFLYNKVNYIRQMEIMSQKLMIELTEDEQL